MISIQTKNKKVHMLVIYGGIACLGQSSFSMRTYISGRWANHVLMIDVERHLKYFY